MAAAGQSSIYEVSLQPETTLAENITSYHWSQTQRA
jgi:hypothetical protein